MCKWFNFHYQRDTQNLRSFRHFPTCLGVRIIMVSSRIPDRFPRINYTLKRLKLFHVTSFGNKLGDWRIDIKLKNFKIAERNCLPEEALHLPKDVWWWWWFRLCSVPRISTTVKSAICQYWLCGSDFTLWNQVRRTKLLFSRNSQ